MSFEIGKVLGTHEPFCLNVKDVVASRTYIASETRFGKSHTARRIVEEILENWVGQVAVIIIDPEGEYGSLREKYPILIIGRDIPIQVETPTLLASTAAFMAEKILEAGASAIIDISVVDPEAGKDYVDKFLRRFFHLQTTAKKPYLVVEEEAEDLAPESGAPGTRTCLEISINLARRGGKRGIGVLYVGHRPAWISKGILSQCPNKAIGRIEEPDMEALERYARIPRSIVEKLVPRTDEQGAVIDPGPERGVFCFTGDWVQKTTFVKVGPVKTTHLGATPEIIPRPVGEVQTVIENVQKALSQLIEKAKPVIASQAEIESKIRTELENKYKGRIETILKTADEKADRKYKVKIEALQTQLEKLSRSQAMQPAAPISDVLEHPIVKARMLQLDDKARDLLTWIEREPGHTREELAARMVSSKDAIAGLVDKINRVFQLEVIIIDESRGKRPIRYKSMLKRLFLTDVGKKEIEELNRAQQHAKDLEEELQTLRPIAQQSATLRDDFKRVSTQYTQAESRLKELELSNKHLKESNEALVKENEAYQKIKEGFQALGIVSAAVAAPFDEEKLRVEVTSWVKEALSSIPSIPVDEKKIEAIVDQKLSTRLPEGSGGVIPTSVELEHKLTHFEYKAPEEHVKVDTTALPGRIVHLIVKTDFFGERHNRKQVVEELLNHGWNHDPKEVDAALVDLCQKGIFYRKISTGNIFWYELQPEAKQLIHE